MEHIVTIYDSTDKALAAARVLASSGFSSQDISLHNRESLSSSAKDAGLWRRLFGATVRDNESSNYSRAIETGGAVLAVRVADTDADRVRKILGTPSSTEIMDPNRVSGVGSAKTTPLNLTREEILQCAEEQLEIEKRQVEVGTARVRRFMTEKPVESKVSLHEEHAEIQRRSVNGQSNLKDIDWNDKVLEFVETDEQVAVRKVARVTEEVVVRKAGSDHVETIRDTVRRQQVEVDHIPREIRGSNDLRKDIKKVA